MDRSSWSARFAFICAAVGSAVGLGNVWRFPSLAFKYGGGAFFVPYVLSLLFIGLPILTMEFALGQVFRSGDIVSFGSMHSRLRGIGVGSVWCGFMVVCYYVAIIAWAITFFFNSFRGDWKMAWADEGGTSFFLRKVVGLGDMTLDDGSLNRSMKLVPQTVIGVAFCWLCIFLSTFKGPRWTGRITYITMLTPLALLIFYACYFGGLEGASDGVDLYIGQWEMKEITSAGDCGGESCTGAWPDAVGQVFFSIGITFGIMTAYASYNPRSQGVQMDALITAFLDFLASFIAGFAVFGALGVYAKATGQDAKDITNGGLLLVFGVIPDAFEALGNEPFGMGIEARKALCAIFFFMVFLLGIDSAFSLCEGFQTCVKDSRLFSGWPKEAVIGMVCCLGFCVSIGYCNDTGLYALDSVDWYINQSMTFVGYMECIACGWVYGCYEQAEKIGWNAWWSMFGFYIIASVLAPRIGLGVGMSSQYAEPGTAAGVLIFFVVFAIGLAVSMKLAMDYQRGRGGSTSAISLAYELTLGNVESLRQTLNEVVGSSQGNLSIPIFWSIFVKLCIPPVLMFMLQLKLQSATFGDYGGYHQWYQGWGIAVASVPWLALLASVVQPAVFDPLMPIDEAGTLREAADAEDNNKAGHSEL